jgi:phospholipid/cholesterol/gamma-HCH transport system substrate-binding protein
VNRPRRTLAALSLAGAVALTAGGCGFNGIYSLPLPGAVANGSNTYTVMVQFADVLDLVPYSAVKVNGATVGHISSITLSNGHADVDCKLLDKVHLPQNTVARIEQTSILGEKYVELEAPTDQPATGHLANDAVIPLSRTDTDASVEEVLGALSALLTSGGVEQIHTIAHEVTTALNGRTAVSRDLLSQLRDFAGGLNVQKQQIVRAISGIDALARTVNGQEGQLIGAIDAVPPALHILTDDRKQLTTMLVSVQHLGHVAVHVINASRSDLVSNLRELRPTLDTLGQVGEVIPKTLGIIITYPTADSVEKEYFGDYGNLSLTIDLSSGSLKRFLEGTQLSSLGNAGGLPVATANPSTTTGHKRSGKGGVTGKLTKTLHKTLKTVVKDVPGGGLGKLLGSLP